MGTTTVSTITLSTLNDKYYQNGWVVMRYTTAENITTNPSIDGILDGTVSWTIKF